MGILADADAVGSQLIATVAAAAIIAVCALVWRILRAVQRLNDHVLPHFVPPTATELRDGAEDNTMPARLGRLEHRLSTHLTEEAAAGVELAEVLAKGTARMESLEDGQTAIKDQLTDTVRRLGAGNPEWRDEEPQPIYAPAADAAAHGLIGTPPRRPTIRPEDA